MTEALVRLVIVTFVIGSVVFMGYKVGNAMFRRTRGAEQSFDEFVDAIRDVARGEYSFLPVTLTMDAKTAIFGLGPSDDRSEVTNVGIPINVFYRPEKCEENKACVCLCRYVKFNVKPIYITTTREEIENMRVLDCERDLICSSLDNIDRFKGVKEEKHLGVTKGFQIARFLGGEERTRTVYLEKHRGTIGVCEKKSCLTEEMKKEIGLREAKEQFDNLVKTFEECEDSCGFTINLPDNYRISDSGSGLFLQRFEEVEGDMKVESFAEAKISNCKSLEPEEPLYYHSGDVIIIDKKNNCIEKV